MAGYHQFHAVSTARRGDARPPRGQRDSRRVGVVWHTQGSGKSLTMVFYAGRVVLDPAMQNPTLVVLTDRNDLDDQLFGTFARCQRPAAPDARAGRETARDLRRSCSQWPRAASSSPPSRSSSPRTRGDDSPAALDRRNIVVDRRRGAPQPVRLHRRLRAPHARRAAERLVHRLHRHADRAGGREHARGLRRLHQRLRHPARRRDGRRSRSTTRAASRSWRSTTTSRPQLDAEFEEVTEGEEVERKEQLKSEWAQLEALVGADARLALVAEDLVRHFEERLRGDGRQGMIVVHEPADRRRALHGTRRAPPGLARRRRRRGRDQGRDDRLGLRPARLAAAHPHQGAARGARHSASRTRPTRSSS